MPEFAPVLVVSASNGYRLDGDAADDQSGLALGGGGDVNGDGFADLLIGAPNSGTGGTDRGLAWVVFGGGTPPAALGLAARVAAGTAYRFQGEAAGDQAGASIANAGDVNGDGFDDLLIGARSADPDAAAGDRGASYLVFGGAAKLEALDAADGTNDNQISLAQLAPARGYRFDGVANGDHSGRSVSGAGDVTGDGFADLVIGAPYADPNSGVANGQEGATTIIFGGANLADLDDDDGSADSRIDLAQVSAGQGLRLDGQTTNPNDLSGRAVAVVGDVNGDGFDDVLIGTPYADPNSGAGNGGEGAAWLFFGRPQTLFTAASLDLANLIGLAGLAGTRFDGVTAGDRAGLSVNGLGDINGDGLADIVIGAPFADPSGNSSGSAYVVFGKTGFGASRELATLNGADGFRLDGLRADDRSGFSVSAAGDVNGDGFGDILVGAYGFDRLGAYSAGAAYVVFGKAQGFAAVIDLGSLNGDTGFRIEGAARDDFLGVTVAAAGDVNGDGFADIVVGAEGAGNNALNLSGSTYVIYGHRAEFGVTRVGTDLNNRINGGKGDDAMTGRGGNDTLIGWEGDDTIGGGDGNDTIDAGDGDDHVDGGSGNNNIKGGLGDDVISTGDGLDTLDGGGDDDTLNGGSWADALTGGEGSDLLNGGSGSDTASYLASTAGISLALDGFFAAAGDAAFDTLISIERITGSNFADALRGNGGVNRLTGSGGNDTLEGMAGNDVLTGGTGLDTQTGGPGLDVFDYNAITESAVAVATRDIITDFNAAAEDKIDLSTIDADSVLAGNNAFSFIGGAAFTGLGQIRVFQQAGNTFVDCNTTGTTAPDMRIQLTGLITLDAADFVL